MDICIYMDNIWEIYVNFLPGFEAEMAGILNCATSVSQRHCPMFSIVHWYSCKSYAQLIRTASTCFSYINHLLFSQSTEKPVKRAKQNMKPLLIL